MMSATFFRSRFDQLFYMIKMLSTGIPNSKEYLDALLNKHMICYINEDERTWITNINKLKVKLKVFHFMFFSCLKLKKKNTSPSWKTKNQIIKPSLRDCPSFCLKIMTTYQI